MTLRLSWLFVLTTWLVAGCAHSSSVTTPETALRSGGVTNLPAYAFHEGGDSLVGAFHVALDPMTLSTTVTPIRGAEAQPPQGQRYDLDIANFLTAESFKITDVTVLGSGNYRVTFSHAHPFPAPNVANPITGTNRADLGYTGRLLILTQGNVKPFFGGAVRASCGVVVGPDGYIEAGQTLASLGPSLATAFPYKLLADEARDNRVGISNGANPKGTYAAASGGWQRVNLGASGTGWTGYDYLHGGQVITNTFVLSKEAVASQQFDFNVALVIQYTDPRGAGGKTYRLPPTVIDALQFAYRLPYAALDCSQIAVTASPIVLRPFAVDTEPVTIKVRDWDANAVETTDATVGDEADVAKVQLGASGDPTVSLDAPGVLTTAINLTSPPSGTGASDAPLTYNGTLSNQVNGPVGDYWAMVRVTDPENGDAARPTYHTGINPETIVPDAARTIQAITYQVAPVTVGPAVPTVIAVSPVGLVGAIDQEITFSAQVTGTVESYSWGFGPKAQPAISNDPTPTIHMPGITGVYQGTLLVGNAGGPAAAFAFTYQVTIPDPTGWNMHTVFTRNWTSNDRPDPPLAALIGGRPALVLQPNDSGFTSPIGFAIATTSNPLQASDWVAYDLPLMGQHPSIAEIDGVPAVLVSESTGATVLYGFASSAMPPDAGAWTTHTVSVQSADQGTMTVYEGTAAVVIPTIAGTSLFRSTVARPTAGSAWNLTTLNATQLFGPQIIAVGTNSGDRLAVGALNGTSAIIYMASTSDPTAPLDWNPNYMNSDAEGVVTVQRVTYADGHDEILGAFRTQSTEQMVVARYRPDDLSPDQLTSAAVLILDTNYLYNRLGLGLLNDRIAVAYTGAINSELYCARALTANPTNSEWQITRPSELELPGGADSLQFLVYDNRLHLAGSRLGNGSAPAFWATATMPW